MLEEAVQVLLAMWTEDEPGSSASSIRWTAQSTAPSHCRSLTRHFGSR